MQAWVSCVEDVQGLWCNFLDVVDQYIPILSHSLGHTEANAITIRTTCNQHCFAIHRSEINMLGEVNRACADHDEESEAVGLESAELVGIAV
jgi:hypothetical protein